MTGAALVVEADSSRAATILGTLGRQGLQGHAVPSVAVALLEAETHSYELVVVDPDAEPNALPLEELVKRFGDLAVLVVASGGARRAIEAIRAGAADFVESPPEEGDLAHAVQKILATRARDREPAPETRRLEHELGLLGESKAMGHVLGLVRRIAPSDVTVLVRGESGTGKELVARALHAESVRASGPFVKVHSAGLPETLLESELFGYEKGAFTGATVRKPGRVEVAEGGTLFLDEIGDITPAMQVKLLRILQEKEYERLGSTTTLKADVRIIAATHRDLEHMIKKGEFREDLFYRLNVVPIWLPPLRARRDDIALLARHFCEKFSSVHGKSGTVLSDAAIKILSRERWPGNVRQLQNFVERLVVLAERAGIGEADVAHELSPQAAFATQLSGSGSSASAPGSETGSLAVIPLEAAMRDAERAAILRALRYAKGNRALAARLLGVGRATLYTKLEELGLGRSAS